MRKLKHHEQKLLKKVDFLQWKSDQNVREIQVWCCAACGSKSRWVVQGIYLDHSSITYVNAVAETLLLPWRQYPAQFGAI